MIDSPTGIISSLPDFQDSEQALVPGTLGVTLEETDPALSYASETALPLGHPGVLRQSLGATDMASSESIRRHNDSQGVCPRCTV